MLLLIDTIPITSCDCERSFSRLRTINTYLRSTMSVDRLNGHSLLYIYIKTYRSIMIILFPNFQEEYN